MPHRTAALLILLGVLVVAWPAPAAAGGGALAMMEETNDELKAMWMDFRIESIDYLAIGRGRPSDRLHQQPYRWVDGDPRRRATPGELSFLVDRSWGGATASGLPAGAAEAAVARAVATWAADPCLAAVSVRQRRPPGGDVTVADHFLGTGGFGDPFAADVVVGGWLGAGGPFLDAAVLGAAVTFVFVDPATGEPTDVDGDGAMDVAAAEIYFNDAFDWTVDGAGGYDVETVALHEVGHALDLGHFGPPPAAAMGPVYAGRRRALEPVDRAGLCAVWAGWSRH